MELYTIDSIFEKRLLRIPDYQRGYAWNKQEINDFWEDLVHLDDNRVHYTGIVTLELVEKKEVEKWEDDKWIIDGKGYKPFYIVDGQQRITTSIILIRAIVMEIDKRNENRSDESKITLSHQSMREITNRYILHETDTKMQKSFLFGYEVDNPSDEYLKNHIFNAEFHSDRRRETLYTRNLLYAKEFFLKKLSKMTHEEIDTLFRKLTRQFQFNIFTLDKKNDNKIDVFVTFETMNNRGKQLTNFEKLKNRLIYLSTLLPDDSGKESLRKKINVAWKMIYEYLGKNPDDPLDDDDFLRNHWIMYYKYSRSTGYGYIDFLLNDKFMPRNVTRPESDDKRLTVEKIDKYVVSLQNSIHPWFYIHNPFYPSNFEYENEENKMLLGRLKRGGYGAFKPLLLASYLSKQNIEDINKLLISAEKYIFSLFTVSNRRSNTGDSEFFGYSREILKKKKSIPDIIGKINDWIGAYYDPEGFLRQIRERYISEKGFNNWKGIRYFLYEYEYWLNERGRTAKKKITWDDFIQVKKDHVTIEHILPQVKDDPYWQKQFAKYLCTKEENYLTHSLGNLLPLSREKNSSLQNKSFPLKKNNGDGVGYYNGSASENKVNLETDWDAQRILDRGIELLEFMEERWDINLGNTEYKEQLLHLQFVKEDK